MTQTLIPLPVPWWISPSVPDLQLTANETGGVIVKFWAMFLDEYTGLEAKQSHDKVVTVEIKRAGWTRTFPYAQEYPITDTPDYAWGEALASLHSLAHDQRTEQLFEQWANSQICPDPSAYRVLNSEWISQYKSKHYLAEDETHYLFLGHDMGVEVIGTAEMSWSAAPTW